MKVAIYSRGLDLDLEAQLINLLAELQKYNIEILLLHALASDDLAINTKGISLFSNSSELDASIDCLISLGGDGTMLDSIELVSDKNIPILGINFGRLGFLASIGQEELRVAI